MATLRADLILLATARGGRSHPVATGYRPQFYFDELDYDCTVTFPEAAWVYPGDQVMALIALSKFASGLLYCQLGEGDRFALREGSKTVATGIVIEAWESQLPLDVRREFRPTKK